MIRNGGEPKLLLSGIDSLYCGFFLEGLGIDWDRLAELKALAQEDRKGFVNTQIGNRSWALKAYGSSNYTYVLQNSEMIVRLGENNQPNVHVQFLSQALWNKGARALLKELRDWFKTIRMTGDDAHPRETRTATVSRVDWSFDFDLPFVDFDEDQFLSKASKDSKHRGNGQPETFSFGRGDIMLRIYDKVKEIKQQSQKVWFYDIWQQEEHCWRNGGDGGGREVGWGRGEKRKKKVSKKKEAEREKSGVDKRANE